MQKGQAAFLRGFVDVENSKWSHPRVCVSVDWGEHKGDRPEKEEREEGDVEGGMRMISCRRTCPFICTCQLNSGGVWQYGADDRDWS